jgi:hypothetical protein
MRELDPGSEERNSLKITATGYLLFALVVHDIRGHFQYFLSSEANSPFVYCIHII